VIDSRAHDGGASIRRRRRCLNPACYRRFTTYERLEHVGLSVVKKDGRREEYERNKLYAGVATACHRRPIPADAVNTLVDEVEAELFQQGVSEVPTRTIGELVMAKLRRLDAIAYIRFASVYRSFDTLSDLQDELAQIAPSTPGATRARHDGMANASSDDRSST
jgi:transcriptional repressor NrdR